MSTQNDPWVDDADKEERGCFCCICNFLYKSIFVFPWTSIAFCVALIVCESMLLDRVSKTSDELAEYTGLEIDQSHVKWVLFGVIGVNGFIVVNAIFATWCSTFCQTHCGCLKDDEDECRRDCANNSFALFLNLWSLITWIVAIAAIIQFGLALGVFLMVLFSNAMCVATNEAVDIINNAATELLDELNKHAPDSQQTWSIKAEDVQAFCASLTEMTNWMGEGLGLGLAVAILQTAMFGVSRANYREARMIGKYDLVKMKNDQISAV